MAMPTYICRFYPVKRAMEERVDDIVKECLEYARLSRRAVGYVDGHKVELWLVTHGPVIPSVTVVVDDFFMKRKHFTAGVQAAQDYFEFLKKKYNLHEIGKVEEH